MSARKTRCKAPDPATDWLELDLMTLSHMRTHLGFLVSSHVADIPGIMTHAAKAVHEVEWMLNALDALKAKRPNDPTIQRSNETP